ncbi:LamG-like jellyroll fold domain-containing protein [Gaoshiqia sp. Z1-71]|uniref:LamG-like jellyroll fold domain-containing protein n=1 Tax=Gaoshiqia hydrogeniformans TaxID=3290090 RepID=UPI003BF83C9E
MLSQAGHLWYTELPDSARAKIRLTSYLLISLSDFSMQEILQLADRKVPLAFIEPGLPDANMNHLLQQISVKQNPLPLICENAGLDDESELPGVILIKPEQMDQVRLESIGTDSLLNSSLFTFRELLCVVSHIGQPADSSLLFRLWRQSGKLPNFIQSPKGQVDALILLIESLNSHRKIYGVIRSGDQLLGRVSWKDYPNRIANGYFCFPIEGQARRTFSPYKAGYQFSPDIILDSPENLNYPKIFKAVELSADFGLSDHFKFNGKIVNRERGNTKEILTYDIEFVKDETRGQVGWFPGRAYVDAGLQSKTSLKTNFSITAWIKPTKIGANNSILGKGKNFVLKLHNGMLTYTMQGIKDYQGQNSKVPVNQWTFVGLVHSAYENRISFYINGELTDQTDLITPYDESDYTLLIGSNLWEEFFSGYMDELKIWTRELNDDEIRRQYQDSRIKHREKTYALIFLVLIPGIVLLLFFLLRRKQKFQPRSSVKAEACKPVTPALPANGEIICCFGGLKVINGQGIDISQRFSPKIKKLFVLIFLYSVDGQKGIATKKLSETLWPGMSPQHAKNTRGTNIQNLKAALASCPGIKLVFRDKLWFLEFGPSVYADYTDVQVRIGQLEKWVGDGAVPEKELKALLDILNQGTLFPNMTESWLDPYVSKMSDRIIELGLRLFDLLDENKQASLIHELAEVISLNDPLNEPSLRAKLRILTRQGKLSLALTLYNHFVRLYRELYQETYPVDFRDLTSEV